MSSSKTARKHPENQSSAACPPAAPARRVATPPPRRLLAPSLHGPRPRAEHPTPSTSLGDGSAQCVQPRLHVRLGSFASFSIASDDVGSHSNNDQTGHPHDGRKEPKADSCTAKKSRIRKARTSVAATCCANHDSERRTVGFYSARMIEPPKVWSRRRKPSAWQAARRFGRPKKTVAIAQKSRRTCSTLPSISSRPRKGNSSRRSSRINTRTRSRTQEEAERRRPFRLFILW
jgi:hypothetical protein